MRTYLGAAIVGLLAACMLLPASLDGQTLRDRLKQRAQERIEQRLENLVDCVATDRNCIEKAQAEGRTVRLTDAEGKALPDGQQPAAAAPAPQQRVGEGAWANYDFVPGERVVFAEDFSRDRVGNFPQRLELLTGSAEVVEWQGRRWLRMNDNTAFRVPLPEALPERFTVEFDLPVPWWGMGFYAEPGEPDGSFNAASHQTSAVVLSGTEAGVYRNAGSTGKSTVDPRNLFADMHPDESGNLSRPFRISLQVDGSYIKLYMDDKRVTNMPNGSFGRERFLVFEFSGTGRGVEAAPLITNLSINAGGLPMYDALMSSGRFATQGILFDTGSDRIRPESTPTLNEITQMLRQHPQLRIRIEGHTDNVGGADSNQTLSEKRAAAVRQHLVGQGIDAGRLEAQGFGAGKPAASNDTAEGRQSNRRVELVRL
jgi:OmpA-OmpF porin, OOP family